MGGAPGVAEAAPPTLGQEIRCPRHLVPLPRPAAFQPSQVYFWAVEV